MLRLPHPCYSNPTPVLLLLHTHATLTPHPDYSYPLTLLLLSQPCYSFHSLHIYYTNIYFEYSLYILDNTTRASVPRWLEHIIVRPTECRYVQATLRLALDAIKRGDLATRGASIQYWIPHATLIR